MLDQDALAHAGLAVQEYGDGLTIPRRRKFRRGPRAGIVLFQFRHRFVDEYFHYAQITLFYGGFWRPVPQLTTIPGYHAFIALILRCIGDDSLDTARIVHSLSCLGAIAGFFALRRRLWPGTETIATAQFLCLPVMVPLFFVLYTDVPAVALLLWATWSTVVGRTFLSSLLLCLLVLVRQHEVVWSGFLLFIAARPANGWSDLRFRWRETLHHVWPYALPVLLFIAFWRWNGAISLSHEQTGMHPDFSFHTGNVFMALLVAGLLLPIQTAEGLRAFAHDVRRRPWMLVIPLLAFAAFWFAFRSNSPWNGYFYTHYLRHFLPTRIAAAIIIACVACSFWRIRLRPAGAGFALCAISALFLSASWLITLRYLIPPFALWLAMREHSEIRAEYATLALWLIFAVLMIYLAIASLYFV